MSNQEHKDKIWKMVSDIGVGMLVTEDEGVLRARPMQIVQKEYDGTLWFYTNLNSAKIEEINQERSVCLSFACPNTKTYVSLSGRAKICRDKNLIDKFWSPFVKAWFPKGKQDENCALLEVKVIHGQHWDSDLSSLEYLYEVAKSNITGSTPASNDSIENEKF
jgi:general stress protein 26